MTSQQENEPVRSLTINALNETHTMCNMLMKTPHYAKMGSDGIFAVIETAKALGVDPRQALGGGLYYVKGKVEMSARMMNSLIRSRKHSIQRDEKSDDKMCILHGKRADNGDEWTESFSWSEAEKAKLTGSPVWMNYPRDMLFARALSRLARQLFPDVIGNTYVEGEIALAPEIYGGKVAPMPKESEAIEATPQITIEVNEKAGLTPEQTADYLRLLEVKYPEKSERNEMLTGICKKYGVKYIGEMTQQQYNTSIVKLKDVKIARTA